MSRRVKLSKKAGWVVVKDDHGDPIQVRLDNLTAVAEPFVAKSETTARKGYMSFGLDPVAVQTVQDLEDKIVQELAGIKDISNIKITPRTIEHNFRPSLAGNVLKVSVQDTHKVVFEDGNGHGVESGLRAFDAPDVKGFDIVVEPGLVWLFRTTIGVTWYLRRPFCFVNGAFGTMTLGQMLGEGSINGEAYSATLRGSQTVFSIKIAPIRSTRDLRVLRNGNFGGLPKGDGAAGELFVTIVASEMVKLNVCPNLPLLYGWGVCNRCTYNNKELQVRRTPKSCLVLANEIAHGDLRDWVKTSHTFREWKVMFFQVFAGLFAMQKYYGMTHNDCHWGNVLQHRIQRRGSFVFTIEGETYTVPNLGCLFVLWDFGYSQIPGVITGMAVDRRLPAKARDYYRISGVPSWIDEAVRGGKQLARAPRAIHRFSNALADHGRAGQPLIHVMKTMFTEFKRRPLPRETVIGYYDMDQTIPNINPMFRRYIANREYLRAHTPAEDSDRDIPVIV
ncbi:hypothetical protein GGF32_003821 [Allomyces javanicus]|nr:hypothetical protein GGF32_003821 [Allomyces javanicus]